MPKDDLISRQAALDIIDSELNGWLTDDERLHLEGVAIGIECLPRIDAVPVVRCKDCKHVYLEDGIWHCPFGLAGGEMFYCSYGARGE